MYSVFSPSVVSLDGSLHDQESRKKVDEDSPDPGRHQVSLRRPEVNVEHHDRHADAEKSRSLIHEENVYNHQSDEKIRKHYPGIRKS